MTELTWDYDQQLDCEVAYLRGYRIRAERDDDACNPFEEWDGNWPIAIYYDGSIKSYERTKGAPIRDVLSRFNDAQLVFNQKHIDKVLEAGPFYDGETDKLVKWVHDPNWLREAFEEALGYVSDSALLDTYEELYKLLGIPCYKTTSRGYSQGDWAEVLVVATPEAQAEFGCKEVTESDLKATADLYGCWAWGDVFGYIIERPVFDEDGEIEDWVAACDHNSCWGFYGDDHDKSGLEEQALASVPDEPVGSSDKMLEAV